MSSFCHIPGSRISLCCGEKSKTGSGTSKYCLYLTSYLHFQCQWPQQRSLITSELSHSAYWYIICGFSPDSAANTYLLSISINIHAYKITMFPWKRRCCWYFCCNRKRSIIDCCLPGITRDSLVFLPLLCTEDFQSMSFPTIVWWSFIVK